MQREILKIFWFLEQGPSVLSLQANTWGSVSRQTHAGAKTTGSMSKQPDQLDPIAAVHVPPRSRSNGADLPDRTLGVHGRGG